MYYPFLGQPPPHILILVTSVVIMGFDGVHPRVFHPRGFVLGSFIHGVFIPGAFIPQVIHLTGHWPHWVFIPRGFHFRAMRPRGFCYRGIVPRGSQAFKNRPLRRFLRLVFLSFSNFFFIRNIQKFAEILQILFPTAWRLHFFEFWFHFGRKNMLVL